MLMVVVAQGKAPRVVPLKGKWKKSSSTQGQMEKEVHKTSVKLSKVGIENESG
jgi:hypothetical protein